MTKCRKCGSLNWKISKTATSVIDQTENKVTTDPFVAEEIRCAVCNQRATIEEHAAIANSALAAQAPEPARVDSVDVSDEEIASMLRNAAESEVPDMRGVATASNSSQNTVAAI